MWKFYWSLRRVDFWGQRRPSASWKQNLRLTKDGPTAVVNPGSKSGVRSTFSRGLAILFRFDSSADILRVDLLETGAGGREERSADLTATFEDGILDEFPLGPCSIHINLPLLGMPIIFRESTLNNALCPVGKKE